MGSDVWNEIVGGDLRRRKGLEATSPVTELVPQN